MSPPNFAEACPVKNMKDCKPTHPRVSFSRVSSMLSSSRKRGPSICFKSWPQSKHKKCHRRRQFHWDWVSKRAFRWHQPRPWNLHHHSYCSHHRPARLSVLQTHKISIWQIRPLARRRFRSCQALQLRKVSSPSRLSIASIQKECLAHSWFNHLWQKIWLKMTKLPPLKFQASRTRWSRKKRNCGGLGRLSTNRLAAKISKCNAKSATKYSTSSPMWRITCVRTLTIALIHVHSATKLSLNRETGTGTRKSVSASRIN